MPAPVIVTVPPLQVMLLSVQPAGTCSVTAYVPGANWPLSDCPLPTEPANGAGPMKTKVSVPVPPTAAFVIVIVPAFALRYVQATFSPGCKSMVARPVVGLLVTAVPPVHTMSIRCHEAAACSVNV